MNDAKRALVTGATGFIGSRLVSVLLADGWALHAITRPQSAVDRLPTADVVRHVDDHTPEGLRKAADAAAPTVVFHLAGYFVANHTPDDIGRLIESNIAFGTRLVEALAGTGGAPLFVNAGTFWQHVDGATYRPAALYAATKQAFEDCLRYYADSGAVRAVNLKLPDTYGPDDPRPKVLNLLLAAALNDETIETTAGEQYVDLVHVDDVAHAFLHAAKLVVNRAGPLSSSFSVSSGRPITIRELVARMEQVIGRKIPVAWGVRPYREHEMFEPWQAGQRLPGWSPRVSLSEGLGAVWQAMAEHARAPNG